MLRADLGGAPNRRHGAIQTLKQARSEAMPAQLGKSLTLRPLQTGLAPRKTRALRVFPSCAAIASDLSFVSGSKHLAADILLNSIEDTKSEESKMAGNRPQIMIADDHAFVADACRKLLEPEFDVVATVGDGRSLVRIAANLKPQVIITDIGMPLLNGLDACCQVKRILRSIKLVFLTMNTDPALAAEAFRRGASGYLLKTCAASELIFAIREVLRGMSYLSPAIAKETVDFLFRQSKEFVEEGQRLTERQREVLQLLTEGKSMKQVASALNVSKETVAFHKYRIKEILNAKNDAELVQYAVRSHLIMV
jgi:DNA-binding NarL/FixJ family response regulator